jgi:hypothetical protein
MFTITKMLCHLTVLMSGAFFLYNKHWRICAAKYLEEINNLGKKNDR